MKKMRYSLWSKLVAAVLLISAGFGAAYFAIMGCLILPYAAAENWQDTGTFHQLLRIREDQLAELFAIEIGLEGQLTYPEQKLGATQLSELKEAMLPENTDFRFQVRTSDGKEIVYSNLQEGEKLEELVSQVYYSSFRRGEYTVELQNENFVLILPELYAAYGAEKDGTEAVLERAGEELVIECGLPEDVTESVGDEFYKLWLQWSESRGELKGYLAGIGLCGVLMLLSLAWLLWSAGYQKEKDGICLTWQEKIPFDFYIAAVAAICFGLVACGMILGEELYYQSIYNSLLSETALGYERLAAAGLAGLFSGLVGMLALALRTLVVRLRAGCLRRTTLVCRVVSWMIRIIHEFVCALPFTWKALGIFAVYALGSGYLLLSATYEDWAMLLWCVVNIGALVLLGQWTMGLRRLRQGTQAIAAGDMEYRVDTQRLPPDLRPQGEDLNNISVGLSGAVEEKMKSERFKAELITNVSHDLKTPLTSIINYVNLLKTTEQTDPKAAEYIEVLDRKSQRLKKLTEDLVEASKASTGVLSVNREKIGMAQLLDQAMGEWEERLEDRKLTVVTSLPEGETWVYADGRHLWRVIDNLLSNCAKYAMEGTRVYVDLVRGKGQVTLSVKNISREQLNVPAERLVERFVRGEESRTTEGSGLGLSIARSLTELQGGQFKLAVDGDLFKAAVILPQAN